jgi:hypothetical protein
MSYFEGLPDPYGLECLLLARLNSGPKIISRALTWGSRRYTYLKKLSLIKIGYQYSLSRMQREVRLTSKGELYVTKMQIDPLSSIPLKENCIPILLEILWRRLENMELDSWNWLIPWLNLNIVYRNKLAIEFTSRGEKLLDLVIDKFPAPLVNKSKIDSKVPFWLISKIKKEEWPSILSKIPFERAQYYSGLLKNNSSF